MAAVAVSNASPWNEVDALQRDVLQDPSLGFADLPSEFDSQLPWDLDAGLEQARGGAQARRRALLDAGERLYERRLAAAGAVGVASQAETEVEMALSKGGRRDLVDGTDAITRARNHVHSQKASSGSRRRRGAKGKGGGKAKGGGKTGHGRKAGKNVKGAFHRRLRGHGQESGVGNLSHVRGVAGAGWLHLEDWMFSWPLHSAAGLPPSDYEYSLVDTQRTKPQGRLFPSDIFRDHPFETESAAPSSIQPWYTDGDLMGQVASLHGEAFAARAIEGHRSSYWTDSDLADMAAAGIRHVRLNVGWWAFASDPLPTTQEIIHDPCYPNKTFVTLSDPFLTDLFSRFAANGLSVLVDLHAMPCGSSDGTYNGVYPQPPIFFTNASAAALGLQVVSNMIAWYHRLPPPLQAAVHGFTLLNEPGHLLVPRYMATPEPALAWLTNAVSLYQSKVVDRHLQAGSNPPLLYLNLIDTLFNTNECPDRTKCMFDLASDRLGLAGQPWAVVDVHHYFSWDGAGAEGIPPANCSSDEALQAYVRAGMEWLTSSLRSYANAANMPNLATSEWSLSMRHNDSQPCAAPSALRIMYEEQVAAFTQAGFAQFFWGWRMPYGGWHEDKWSLKHYLTGRS